MNLKKNQFQALATLCFAAAITACGGGGGGTAVSTPTLSGTAAVGAPLSGASITVFDAKGEAVGSGITGSNGLFSITLSKVGTAPYLLKLTTDSVTLHAVHPEGATGEVNITPLSEALTALLSPTGVAADLMQAPPEKVTIAEKQEVLATALSSMTVAAGATGNLFTQKFAADGTGVDKVLDSIAVMSVADGATQKASVQIALKLATDPENATQTPPVINLSATSTNSQVQAAVGNLPTISSDDLTDPSAGRLYEEFLENMNACYADGPAVRTDGVSVVKSAACKKIFFNNDPAQYLNFGQRLGARAQFAGMFTYTGTVTFLATDKPYLVHDMLGKKRGDGVGRAIVGLSWINSDANRENILLYVAKYKDASGKELLGLTGDRNEYGWAVNSHNQKREFPLRADSSLDYVTSSYLISVRDVTRNGNKLNFATVRTPSGKTVLMAGVRGGAARDLAICSISEVNLDATGKVPTTPKNSESGRYYCTGSSKAITFSQRFVSDRETRVPSDIWRVGILRPLNANGQPYTPTSDEVKALPNIGLWTITYNFVDGGSVTQRTWSVSRPMSAEELMGPNGPDAVTARYTAATITAMKALKTSEGTLNPCSTADTNCVATESPIPAPSSGGFAFEWTASSKVPVTFLWASGSRNADATPHISSTNATPWDDQRSVRSSATRAEIMCGRQSADDQHCANEVIVGGEGNYNTRSWMSYSELWGKDTDQRTFMRSYNWFQPRRDSTGAPF